MEICYPRSMLIFFKDLLSVSGMFGCAHALGSFDGNGFEGAQACAVSLIHTHTCIYIYIHIHTHVEKEYHIINIYIYNLYIYIHIYVCGCVCVCYTSTCVCSHLNWSPITLLAHLIWPSDQSSGAMPCEPAKRRSFSGQREPWARTNGVHHCHCSLG